MKKTDIARYESYTVLLGVMNDHREVIDQLAYIEHREKEFAEAVDAIAAIAPMQVYSYQEEMARYRVGRQLLIERMCVLSRSMVSYSDAALVADVDYSKRALTRMRKLELINLATVMLERAKNFETNECSRPFVGKVLDSVAEQLEVVKSTNNAFRNRQLKQKGVSRQLKAAFERAKEAKNGLFLTLDILHFKHPDIYRMLIDAARPVLSMRRVSVMGEVMEAKTEYPIANVKIFVRNLNSEVTAELMALSPDVKRKSTAKGRFYAHHLAEGHYLLTASKPGYVTTHQIVAVAASETTRVPVMLVKG